MKYTGDPGWLGQRVRLVERSLLGWRDRATWTTEERWDPAAQWADRPFLAKIAPTPESCLPVVCVWSSSPGAARRGAWNALERDLRRLAEAREASGDTEGLHEAQRALGIFTTLG